MWMRFAGSKHKHFKRASCCEPFFSQKQRKEHKVLINSNTALHLSQQHPSRLHYIKAPRDELERKSDVSITITLASGWWWWWWWSSWMRIHKCSFSFIADAISQRAQHINKIHTSFPYSRRPRLFIYSMSGCVCEHKKAPTFIRPCTQPQRCVTF